VLSNAGRDVVRRVTLEDVAAETGVSRALVSLVMRDSPRVSAASRRLVLDAANRLGYRPNLMARNLASRQTMTIGLLLNDLHNPWFAEIADGIFAEADAKGYRIILGSGRRSAAREDEMIESFLSFRVDGVIVAGCRLPPSRIEEVGVEVPLVSVGRAIRSTVVATVNSDDQLGARLAVQHLVDLGHKNIVHIDGGRGAGASPRRTGYLAAMKELGLTRFAKVMPADFTEQAGAAAVAKLLAGATMPTALFTSNDLLAIGALDRLEQAGLSVPDDVSIVGYDNTSLAALHHISLPTVDQPREQMGRVAFATLMDKLGDNADADAGSTGERAAHHVMSPVLVERRTTRRTVDP